MKVRTENIFSASILFVPCLDPPYKDLIVKYKILSEYDKAIGFHLLDIHKP